MEDCNPYESPKSTQDGSAVPESPPLGPFEGRVGFLLSLVAATGLLATSAPELLVKIIGAMTAFASIPSAMLSGLDIFTRRRYWAYAGLAISMGIWWYLPTLWLKLKWVFTR